ncbi:putative prephenate dehydrogenase [Purpureocillium lavendulum]|uniref:Prephenate dehydrogenase n=1 Tax=Purpureocillium lavendulum TaxID=1247861 RepID=A0AB34FLD0_9HYPO|nr:putative prephenate dehydrogenase [Purpureocillium lavendulum]
MASPSSTSSTIPAAMENFVVGLIGMGDMGKMYAERLSAAGWSYDSLKEKYAGKENIEICRNGHYVSRASDYVIYSVEAAVIDRVIAQYGPSTKMGAIVGGQTSCKSPEIAAFEAYLPQDPLVLIQHRAPDAALHKVEAVLGCLRSKFVYLTALEHDRITADTQAVTHAAFLSMGKAWHANTQFPWELSRQKWHVYAGLAILNPEARKQVAQYAKSVTELYKLMLEGDLASLRARMQRARERVFGASTTWGTRPLIEPSILSSFSLGTPTDAPPRANNHLSLLAMVDCWSELGIVPYDHMLCSTPLFRLRLGVTEHLFRNAALLDEAVRTAVEDKTYRSDDLEFTFAARGWAECVTLGHFETWEKRFVSTQEFFEPRFAEAKVVGDQMMKKVLEGMREEETGRSGFVADVDDTRPEPAAPQQINPKPAHPTTTTTTTTTTPRHPHSIMSVKFERDTIKQTAQNVMSSAVPENGRIPGTSGKHPVAERVGTALTGGIQNAGTKGYLAAYIKQLESNPLRTKMLTAGSLAGAQELLASWLAKDRNKHGHYFTSRVPKMAAYGALVSAPIGHVLIWALQKVFKGRTSLKAKILQILASNLIIAPIQNSIYLVAMALIAGARTYHQVRATVKVGFWRVMKVSWLTSPICLAFAQKFLPDQLWVPFFNIVGFIIGTYINTTTKKKRLAALRRKHFGDGRPSNMGGRPEDYPPPPMGSNPPY